MVTLTPPPDPVPHPHLEIAESFGADADRYDRARPRYPRSLADAVLAGLPVRRVLHVGYRYRYPCAAVPTRRWQHIVGVQADPRMAQLARSRGFQVDVARFEDWDAPDPSMP